MRETDFCICLFFDVSHVRKDNDGYYCSCLKEIILVSHKGEVEIKVFTVFSRSLTCFEI